MVSRVIPVAPFDLVIFGGTGDLAQRKILPGLFRRFCAGQMPAEARIIGAARSEITDDEYRAFVAEAIGQFGGATDPGDRDLAAFLECVSYQMVDARGEAGWDPLRSAMSNDGRVEAFYFSVAPGLFGDIAERLHAHGMVSPECRVVVEKPFGRDLQSARKLNATLAEHFDESQIYRIDHYLGKETVQNLMAVRFGNVLFEPLWNSQ